MTSATGATRRPVVWSIGSAIARILRGLAWAVFAAAIAFGSAGIIGTMAHPPGSPSRAELTYANDQALIARLAAVEADLGAVGDRVDALAADAKSALASVGSADGTALKTALDHGTSIARAISIEVDGIRDSLAGLPGEGPLAELQYSNDTLVRRAALLAALDAASGLASEWSRVAVKSNEAAQLTSLIVDHDTTVAAAAAQGVGAKYAAAIVTLNGATAMLDQLDALRDTFVKSSDVTVLDEWLARHRRYDSALLGLYTALRASGGKRNPQVDNWYREQSLALDQLPGDNRAIIAIIAQVAQGGLNQAVIAIDDTRGHIDRALDDSAPI